MVICARLTVEVVQLLQRGWFSSFDKTSPFTKFCLRQCFWSGVASKLRRRLRTHWNVINTSCHFIYCRFSMQTFLLFWLALLPLRVWSVWKISGLAVWCVALVIHFCRHYFYIGLKVQIYLSNLTITSLINLVVIWGFVSPKPQNIQFQYHLRQRNELNYYDWGTANAKTFYFKNWSLMIHYQNGRRLNLPVID